MSFVVFFYTSFALTRHSPPLVVEAVGAASKAGAELSFNKRPFFFLNKQVNWFFVCSVAAVIVIVYFVKLQTLGVTEKTKKPTILAGLEFSSLVNRLIFPV